MRNLLQLIIRYSNFLLLVGLEVVAFIFVIRGNKYQQMVASGAANTVTAGLQLMNDNLLSYFRLRADNAQLLDENTQLLEQNQLLQAENTRLLEQGAHPFSPDTHPYALAQSSVSQDAAESYLPPTKVRQRLENGPRTDRERLDTGTSSNQAASVPSDMDYAFIPARVIAFSNDRHHNYLTLNKGRRDGITPDMGVIGKDGIVGVVQSVSTHFAVVAPVIHEGLFISSKIRKNDYMATLHWHVPDTRHAALEDVARHVNVQTGDTIVTSGMSAIFPADLPVGVVSDVSIGEGDSYYDISVALATDFRSLRTVHVLKYNLRAELDSIQ